MLMNGVSNIASELDDGPAPLASFLITMVHSYSMTNLGSLEYWKNLVEKEVNDVPVSKHPVHVSELRRVIKGKSVILYHCYSHNLSLALSFSQQSFICMSIQYIKYFLI